MYTRKVGRCSRVEGYVSLHHGVLDRYIQRMYIYIYINKHISPPISPHLFPQPYLSSWYLPIYILSLIPHIGFIALSL